MKYRIVTLILFLSLCACGKREDPPESGPVAREQGIVRLQNAFDEERKELEMLRVLPSVTSASIESNDDAAQYTIDLDSATAWIWVSGQEKEAYPLDQGQMEGLKRLLSEYALTVYDGMPYWPSGDYCTMIELFDFSIHYDGGYYREYGATHYPDGWEAFMEELREWIVPEN